MHNYNLVSLLILSGAVVLRACLPGVSRFLSIVADQHRKDLNGECKSEGLFRNCWNNS